MTKVALLAALLGAWTYPAQAQIVLGLGDHMNWSAVQKCAEPITEPEPPASDRRASERWYGLQRFSLDCQMLLRAGHAGWLAGKDQKSDPTAPEPANPHP